MRLRELLERYLREMKLGESHCYGLARLQTYPIAQLHATELRPSHFIDFGRMRRQSVSGATVLADINFLRGVLSYATVGWDIAGVSEKPLVEALPKMRQLRLIAKSRRRSRIPTDQERPQIRDWLRTHYHGEIPILDIADFQDYSSRRIGETTRLQRGDLDADHKTILVRDMKHPHRKEGNNKRVALPDEAFAILIRQPKRSEAPTERFFPYSAKTIEGLYRKAVIGCAIEDLHLHDSRRWTVTWLYDQGRSVRDVMLVTGHETPQMPLTVYNGSKAEDFHKPRVA